MFSFKFTIFIIIALIFSAIYQTFSVNSFSYKLLFEFILGVLFFNLLGAIFYYKLYKKKVILLLHISILLILLGGFITKHFSFNGYIHLKVNKHYSKPFNILLKSITIKKYKASNVISFYKATLLVNSKIVKVTLNNPITINEYKIYLISIDKDLKGALFLFKKDYGYILVYLGYSILLLLLIYFLFKRVGILI